MRRNSLVAAFAIVALLSFVSFAAAPAAADPGNGNGVGQGGSPPGNNGTIKIHAGDGEAEPVVANEPHPGCTFHVHGFFFDAGAAGTWSIVAWPPTGDGTTTVSSGSWHANASGEWRTAVMTLASGHYKAFATQTGAPGGAKQKVFWVECGAAGGTASPTPTPGAPTPTPTPVVGGGGSSPTPTPTPTPTPVVGGGGSSATPSPTPTQLGVQQPPLTGGVSPIVETGGAPAGQQGQVTTPAAPAVRGAEQAPAGPGQAQARSVPQPLAPAQISGLPSTSTAPVGLGGPLALFSALAALAWRRPRR